MNVQDLYVDDLDKINKISIIYIFGTLLNII